MAGRLTGWVANSKKFGPRLVGDQCAAGIPFFAVNPWRGQIARQNSQENIYSAEGLRTGSRHVAFNLSGHSQEKSDMPVYTIYNDTGEEGISGYELLDDDIIELRLTRTRVAGDH